MSFGPSAGEREDAGDIDTGVFVAVVVSTAAAFTLNTGHAAS